MLITQIKPNPNNPRIIKDHKFKLLVKSIQEFPQMLELRPIVIDENNIVLGGNMRLKACIEAGLTEVPVKVATLTEQQKNEFIIKDNVGFGEWDWSDIANNWEIEQINDWGLDIPGFELNAGEQELKDLSDKLKSEFKIEIICKSEEEQEQTYNKLIEQNYECRLLTL